MASSSAALSAPAPRLRLEGKVCLVTGGTSGIGLASAEAFLAEGAAAVIITGRRKEKGETFSTAHPGKGFFIQADHSTKEGCAAAAAAALAMFPTIHVLFNNVGIVTAGDVLSTSDSDFEEVLQTNLHSAFRMTKLLLPQMLAVGKGCSIVNCASDWGLVAAEGFVAYCVSKAALVQFTKCVALEVAKKGVRVNAVCPGDTQVERWAQEGYYRGGFPVAPEDSKENPELPMGRVAAAEEIAKAVVFLASDDSSYMTGAAVPVDGGNTSR